MREITFLGVSILAFPQDRVRQVTKIIGYGWGVLALLPDGRVGSTTHSLFERGRNGRHSRTRPELADALRALGAIDARTHQAYLTRHKLQVEARHRAAAAQEIRRGAEVIGLKLNARQSSALEAAISSIQ